MNIFDFLQSVNEVGYPVQMNQTHAGLEYHGNFELLCLLDTQQIAIFVCKDNYTPEFKSLDSALLTISSKANICEINGKSFSIEGDYVIIKFERPRLNIGHAVLKPKGKYKDKEKDKEVEEKRIHTRFHIENYDASTSIIIHLGLKKQVKARISNISRGGCLMSVSIGSSELFEIEDLVVFHNLAGLELEDFAAEMIFTKPNDEREDSLDIAFRFDTPLNMSKILEIVRRCKNNS